jgi:hypothetical protein
MVRRHKHINKILQRNNNTRNRARMEARTEDAQLANPVATRISRPVETARTPDISLSPEKYCAALHAI